MRMLGAEKPLVDMTSFNGVESLFHEGATDPWARQLAGEFADVFIYSDAVRYILPVHRQNILPVHRQTISAVDGLVPRPTVLVALQQRDSQAFQAQAFSTAEPKMLRNEYIDDCFRRFDAWATSNKITLRRWLELHRTDWIQSGHRGRVKNHFVFDLDELQKRASVASLASHIGVSEHELLYAFDVILRYPIYGELAGEQAGYR